MSKTPSTVPYTLSYDEMQAAMQVGRRLRSEAFAEFFGFGATARKAAEDKKHETVRPALRPMRLAQGC